MAEEEFSRFFAEDAEPCHLRLAACGSARARHRQSDVRRLPVTLVAQPIDAGLSCWCDRPPYRTIHPGQILIVPPNRPHRYRLLGTEPPGVRWVHLAARAAFGRDPIEFLRIDPVVDGAAAAPLGRSLQELIAAAREQTGAATTETQRIAAAVEVGRLAHVLLGQLLALGSLAPSQQASVPESLRRVFECIEKRLQQPLCLEDLALAGQCSTSHLHALFRRHLAQTPMQFLREQRLLRAHSLLVATSLPIYQVAQKCGFADQFHFSRVFKRRYGSSPQRYRGCAVV